MLMCEYVRRRECVLMSGWRPEVDTGCLPQLLSMLSFEEVSLDPEPISWLEWLASKLWVSSCLFLPVPGLQDAAAACFYMGAGDLDSGLWAYMESTN